MILAADIEFRRKSHEDQRQVRIQSLANAVLADPDKTLLIAGDVTKAGSARGFIAAGEFVERLIGHGATVLIVPGNHDLRTTWKHNGEANHKQRVAGICMEWLMSKTLHQSCIRFSYGMDWIAELPSANIIGLQTCWGDKDGIRTEQLGRLEEAFLMLEDRPHLPVVVLLHHSFWESYPKRNPPISLRKDNIRFMNQIDVTHLVTGHNHSFRDRDVEIGGRHVQHIGLPRFGGRGGGYVSWVDGETKPIELR